MKIRNPAAVASNISKKMKLAGKPVEDATAPLPITITKSDVRQGALKNATSCAAAVAICNQGFAEARVHVARSARSMSPLVFAPNSFPTEPQQRSRHEIPH